MPDVVKAADPPESATAAELAKIELEVFGPDLARRPDGRPLEDGHGSFYQRASAASKARYHALLTLQAHEGEVASLASQLEAAKARLVTSRKAVTDAKAHAEAEAKAAATRQGEAAALTKQAGKDADAAQKASLDTAEKARLAADTTLAHERAAADEEIRRRDHEAEAARTSGL